MKMTFRWYGPNDCIPLDYIKQIPAMTGVVTAVYDMPVGEVWGEEQIQALLFTPTTIEITFLSQASQRSHGSARCQSSEGNREGFFCDQPP